MHTTRRFALATVAVRASALALAGTLAVLAPTERAARADPKEGESQRSRSVLVEIFEESPQGKRALRFTLALMDDQGSSQIEIDDGTRSHSVKASLGQPSGPRATTTYLPLLRLHLKRVERKTGEQGRTVWSVAALDVTSRLAPGVQSLVGKAATEGGARLQVYATIK
jgi:hypothetical protein